jgi:8-hydroxy-5-deazaflavin:NADPH oxidoreductase
MSTISIIGSGDMAAVIGILAAQANHAVEVSSRNPAKAQTLVERIGGRASTLPFGSTPNGDIVLLAVPYSVIIDVVQLYGAALSGKILVDITNPIKNDFSGFLTPEASFGALEIAKAAPVGVKIVKAFNVQSSKTLAAGNMAGEPLDVFIAGDDPEAKNQVSSFISSLSLHPLDAGPLTMAHTLEHACMLWLRLMTQSIGHGRFALRLNRLS